MKYRLIRGSEVQDFLRCRYRWKRAWVDRIRPKRQDGKLFFGQLCHKFLEVYYSEINHPDPFLKLSAHEKACIALKKMFDETDVSRMDQLEVDDLLNLADKVVSNYVSQWGEIDSRWKVLATELTFAIPLANGIAYTGTIDLIYLDEHGRLIVADHKSTTSITRYEDNAEMDRQISRYLWAVGQLAKGEGYVWHQGLADIEDNGWMHTKDAAPELLGKEPYAFMYNIILKDYPEPPELLKKGGLSKNKAQKTTFAAYMQSLQEYGLDEGIEADINHPGHYIIPGDHPYAEILIHLNNQEGPEGTKFFRRKQVTRHPEELEAAIQEFYATAFELNHLRATVEDNYQRFTPGEGLVPMHYDPIYRNITHDCSWDCGFKGLCQSSMDGSDADRLLELFYEPKEDDQIWLSL